MRELVLTGVSPVSLLAPRDVSIQWCGALSEHTNGVLERQVAMHERESGSCCRSEPNWLWLAGISCVVHLVEGAPELFNADVTGRGQVVCCGSLHASATHGVASREEAEREHKRDELETTQTLGSDASAARRHSELSAV